MDGGPDPGRMTEAKAPRMPADALRRLRPAPALAAGAALLIAIIVALAVVHGLTQYRNSVEQARRNAENLTLTLADQTRHAVAAVDQLLAGVGEGLRLAEAAGAGFVDVQPLLLRLQTVAHVEALLLVDARGRVTHRSDRPDTEPLDLSGDPSFRVHAGALPGPRLYVGEPVLDPGTGRFLLPMSRRLAGPTEEFAGVVVALVEPQQFLQLFRALDVGREGVVALWSRTGTLVARSRDAPGAVGRPYAGGSLYRALAAGRLQGTEPTVSPVDGVARILSWRAVADQPLVVSVALAEADYLAEWHEDVAFTALSTFVTILVVFCLTVLHHRQLRRAERATVALRVSEQRFRDFADASSDWYWEQDETLRFTHISVANRPWSTFAPAASYGKTRRETTALGVSEEQWARHDADMAARRPLRDFRSQRIDADGRVHHLSVSGVPVFDAAGAFRGYRGTGRDITAEVEAVETLRAVVDAIPAMINAKDVDSRYVLMNALQAQLYGTTPEHAVGLTSGDLVGEEHGRRTAAIDRRVVESGEATGFYEEHYAGADGVVRDWLSAKLPVKDLRGRVRLVISVAMEITDRKAAEEQVMRAQAALLEAKEGAERANRAKSAFLANMSHELRTPLNAVIGFSEVMMREVFGPLGLPRYKDYARDIHRSGTHLLDLINDILDMAKIEVGKRELQLEAIDLKTEILETMRLIQWRVGEGSVGLVTELDDAPPTFRVDRRAVRQILLNLVGNAVKFTPAGGTVTVACRADPGGLALVVADTGCGIAPEHLAQLGTPFFQAHSVNIAGKEGTGLGLALTKSLVEMHGGRLVIESTLGAGTTVTALFPIETAPESTRSAA
jgi:PAS domain S-box-containing protein